MNPLHTAFVTIADLPEGGGGTSRLRTLVGTLRQVGHHVSIWNEHALSVAPRTIQKVEGHLDGAPYSYVLGTLRRGHGFGSLGTKLRATERIAKMIQKARREQQLDVLIFNQLTFYDTFPLTLLARRLGIPTIQVYDDERLELVSENSRAISGRLFGMNSWLADRFCSPLADAIVVISEYLKSKYERLSGSPQKVYLVPTIVDCKAWNCPSEEHSEKPTLLYSGCFGEQDDMENLVEALAILRAQGFHFRMVMLGGNERDPERMRNLRSLIEKRGLSSLLDMPGFVPRERVRLEIQRSNILLNIRRDGVWARSGLSTKLSEYLASGRLVVTTDVGDVRKYLTHGESALLLSPGAKPAEIANALAQALSSRELRRRIGAGGREVAKRFFDVSVAKAKLSDLLHRITFGQKNPN